MSKTKRGPYVLAAGAAVQLLVGIPAAWGVFQRPVMREYAFTRGQATLAFAILVAARNEEAVISPSWSIHSGAGSRAYTFIWGMVGENQDFDDMDNIEMKDLR